MLAFHAVRRADSARRRWAGVCAVLEQHLSQTLLHRWVVAGQLQVLFQVGGSDTPLLGLLVGAGRLQQRRVHGLQLRSMPDDPGEKEGGQQHGPHGNSLEEGLLVLLNGRSHCLQ